MIRSLALLFALTAVVPLAAAAQSAPAPVAPAPPAASATAAPHAHHHSRYLAALHTLTLTPDQQSQIDGFLRDTKAANAGADKTTRHANVKKLHTEIAGVLTAEQRAQLKATLVQQRTDARAQ